MAIREQLAPATNPFGIKERVIVPSPSGTSIFINPVCAC